MKLKRSLGQNFFVNKNLCTRIVKEVIDQKPNLIVEVGPGSGSFTQFLYKAKIPMILVEKDNSLSSSISDLYPDAKTINIDFLDWDMNELEKYRGSKILFFGSLPYNVSKPIIRKVLYSKYFSERSFFIIQKEVAEKYIAKEPNNNILSISTQLFATPKRLINISPESFKPRPNVNSSLISFVPKNTKYDFDLESFEKFLYICFKQPRKTLRNNMKKIKIDEREIDNLLSKRPSHLSLDEYIYLFSKLDDHLI